MLKRRIIRISLVFLIKFFKEIPLTRAKIMLMNKIIVKKIRLLIINVIMVRKNRKRIFEIGLSLWKNDSPGKNANVYRL